MTELNHQLFEAWLLSSEPLSEDDARALREHLQSCNSCMELAQAWQGVETELRRASLASPTPGFSLRWQARWEQEMRRKHRRQTLYILLFSLGGAMGLWMLLGMLFWPVLREPLPFLLTVVYQTFGMYYSVNASVSVIFNLLQTALTLIPTTLWVGIITAVLGLVVVWIISMKQLTSTRRVIS